MDFDAWEEAATTFFSALWMIGATHVFKALPHRAPVVAGPVVHRTSRLSGRGRLGRRPVEFERSVNVTPAAFNRRTSDHAGGHFDPATRCEGGARMHRQRSSCKSPGARPHMRTHSAHRHVPVTNESRHGGCESASGQCRPRDVQCPPAPAHPASNATAHRRALADSHASGSRPTKNPASLQGFLFEDWRSGRDSNPRPPA